jgi:hypothetical protein
VWYDAPMPKRPLHILSLISAVVCVLSLMLVVRSFSVADWVHVPTGQRSACGAGSVNGILMLSYIPSARFHGHPVDRAESPLIEYAQEHAATMRPWSAELWEELIGVRWFGIGWGNTRGAYILILPLWLVPLLTAVLPVRWWGA